MPQTDNGKPGLSRRQFLTVASGAGASVALAACGGTQGGFSGKPATARKPEHLNGQLVISATSTTFLGNSSQALADAYQKVQPDVKLVWNLQDLDTSSYTTWLGTQLEAGDIVPDIATGVYQKDFAGWLDFEKYRYTENPYTRRSWNQDLQWDQAQAYNVKGVLLGVPTGTYSVQWYYNKNLFDKAKVDPPTNWDQFAEVSAKLKAKGITPIVANYIYQVPQWLVEIYSDQYMVDWVETVRAQKGDWDYDPLRDGKFKYDPSDKDIHLKYTFNAQRYYHGIKTGKLRFDTPQVAAFAKGMSQIFPQYATEDFFVIDDPYPVFLQQEAAMMVNSTDYSLQLRKDMANLTPQRLAQLGIKNSSVSAFDWDSFLMPSMQGPLVLCPAKSIEGSGASPSIINKNQTQANLALDFMKFFNSWVGYKPYLAAELKSPSFSPDGPLDINGVQYPPAVQKALGNIVFKGQAEINYNILFLAWTGGSIATTAVNLLASALKKQITPEQFGKKVQQLVEDNFDTIIKQSGFTQADIDNPAERPTGQ